MTVFDFAINSKRNTTVCCYELVGPREKYYNLLLWVGWPARDIIQSAVMSWLVRERNTTICCYVLVGPREKYYNLLLWVGWSAREILQSAVLSWLVRERNTTICCYELVGPREPEVLSWPARAGSFELARESRKFWVGPREPEVSSRLRQNSNPWKS